MLITVEDLEKFTGVSPDEERDQRELFVGQASDIVCDYLGYNPILKNYTMFLDGNNLIKINVNAKPIVEVEDLFLDGKVIEKENYFFEDDEICLLDNNIFTSGNRNIKIKFTAGYETLPPIIKLTALRIQGILQTESDNNIGITSKNFATEGTRTFVNTTNFDRYLIAISRFKLWHQ